MKKLFALPAIFIGHAFAQVPPAPSPIVTAAQTAADGMKADIGTVAVAVLALSVVIGLFVLVRGFLKRP